MKTYIPVLAFATAAMSAGCAWTVNIATYRSWVFIPAVAFPQYQQAHALHFVPLAALFGLSSLVLTLLVAWRGLTNVPRAQFWAAAVMAFVPWVATPVYFIPLQGQLGRAGPTPELVSQLVNSDLVLRAIPPTLQLVMLGWALLRYGRASQG